jgi:hypothetical protein
MQIKQADGEYFDAAVVQREWLAGFITAMNTMWSEPAMQITANADPMTDRWQELAPMNTALGAVGVAEVGGKITFSVAVLTIHFPSTSTKSMTR